ncbi:MAG: hypothetical protein JW984_04080 [Deltaproteobacteria bacterium]|uniref:Uncharacterized protein n=1 Tax=Candidatus Zymogenus saltonus TaxID=2844893 RepID=A0A9D8PNQ9_9DELT|nr:hypothetical protein [Candidatus Zymogenus saltonus]
MEDLFRNEAQLLIFVAKTNLVKRYFDGRLSLNEAASRMMRIDTLEMLIHYCDFVEYYDEIEGLNE